MLRERLRRADQVGVLTAMEALASVTRPPALVDCVRATVHPLLPHETFVFGAGAVQGRGFTDYTPVGFRFPLAFLETMRQGDGSLQTPSIARWLQRNEPELFESEAHAHRRSEPWLRSFDRYELHNMAAHGVVDRASRRATFFSFFRIADRLGERQRLLLRLLAPHLHVALQRCVSAPAPGLSDAQREIVRYLVLGKTNWEIARILGLSERNAKYHVEEIIRKLGVVNRTQAAAKAASLGLVEQR